MLYHIFPLKSLINNLHIFCFIQCDVLLHHTGERAKLEGPTVLTERISDVYSIQVNIGGCRGEGSTNAQYHLLLAEEQTLLD